MKKAFLYVSVLILFCACNGQDTVDNKFDRIPLEKESNKIVTDNLGHKYRQIRPEKTLSSMLHEIELWEKIDPPDNKRYYTPTLGSKRHPELPPIFISVER